MLKHHRSTLFDFLPMLKHQLSAVLHLQQLFRFFSVTETPAFQSSDSKLLRSQMIRTADPRHNQKPLPQQHHHEQASYLVG
jgi:hypothetical protein